MHSSAPLTRSFVRWTTGEHVAETSVLVDDGTYREKTCSLCPVCKKVIDAHVYFDDGKVMMESNCRDHGRTVVEVYSDAEDYIAAQRFNKPGASPRHRQSTSERGCPNDCGLCEEHRQHTCVGIVEITRSCNLRCPVCFADAQEGDFLPLETIKGMIDLFVKCEEDPEVLQISGGEPTLHPDIIEIMRYSLENGIMFPTLNTNGIKLADMAFVQQIAELVPPNKSAVEGPRIYLQFDGLNDEIYEKMRGRKLLDIKMKAIANCREAGVKVVLVPTIIKGINDDQIGPIIDLALSDENINMVNFQPATQVGRYEVGTEDSHRITIPELLQQLEKQTKGLIKKDGFINVPCPFPTCSACSYLYQDNGEVITLTDLFDVDAYMDFIKDRVLVYGKVDEKIKQALDALLSISAVVGSDKNNDAICVSCGMAIPEIDGLMDKVTVISVHAFMDEANFDLRRAQKCCVTEILPDGKMIPFCVYNNIYREKLEDGYYGG